MSRFSAYIRALLNLSEFIDRESAENAIRKNISFRGPTVFILACAIIIASVGLNVNSIPVIIGAMLISPVMGPILGFGFGLATLDNELVKDSLRNFLVMVVISILASTVFFLLSPLTLQNPSELLARTNPSVYDVLIALFGGFAGMFEISRREKGTVISGVAIATALMPPLCTIGYGLSILSVRYIFGALYLFLINSIFIALATFLTSKYLHFPTLEAEQKQHLSRHAVSVILAIIIVPSVISAFRIVQENNFNIHAEKLISSNKTIGKGFIYDYRVNYAGKDSAVDIYLAGEELSAEERERFYVQAETYGIPRSQIIFHEDAAMSRGENISESELIKSIYEYNDQQFKTMYEFKDQQVRELSDSLSRLTRELAGYRAQDIPADVIARELFAQYPAVKRVSLSGGSSVAADASAPAEGATDAASPAPGVSASTPQVVAVLYCKPMLDAASVTRIENWLRVRLTTENVLVLTRPE